MAAKRITLDGKVLDNPDQYGDWGVATIEGWWHTPDGKGQNEERPQQDGDFDLPVYYGARYITLSGSFTADSEAQMFQGMIRFAGLLRSPGRLVVTGYGPDMWADVKRSSGSAMVIDPVTDRHCKWQAKIKSSDSRKFGTTATFTMPAGATVSVFHRGNYPATPRITVTGSMPGYTLTVNGASYAVSVPLVSGTPHVIDYNDGRLRVNGLVVQNSIGNTNLSTIPPGLSVAAGLFATSGGTGTATMALPDTYI
ncbi:hypothetical protein [Arthrobacter sp. UYCu723]